MRPLIVSEIVTRTRLSAIGQLATCPELFANFNSAQIPSRFKVTNRRKIKQGS